MRRIVSKPRDDWRKKVEDVGLLWHSGERHTYWNESAFYEFTLKDVEILESATNELAQMTLLAAQHIVDTKAYARMGIPENAVGLIEKSWDLEPPSLYGRFDFAYDGIHPPKLLEYIEDAFPRRNQFNSIHERLIARWTELTPYLPERRIDFCSMDDIEDGMTTTYLMETARQAGLTSSIFPIDEIGWDGSAFVGPDERPLSAVFKLYPWEWMVREEFAKHLVFCI